MFLLSVGVLGGLGTAAVAAVLLLLVTAPGHRLVQKWALGALRGAVNGTVEVGSLGGALWRAADVRDVTIADSTGKVVIRAERIRATFAVTDLVRGRYRFSHVSLVRPVVVLEQDTHGRWNIDGLFKKGAHDSTRTVRRPLVELREVAISDGTVIVRERPGPRRDHIRQRTFTGVTAGLDRLRVSHPDSTGVAARFNQMIVRIDDPAADVRGGRGDALLDGDTLRFALTGVVLPASEIDVAGLVKLSGQHTNIRAEAKSSRFAFADLRGLLPQLPEEGGGRGELTFNLPGDGSAMVDIHDGEMRSGRSLISGHGLIAIGAHGGVSLRGVDAMLKPLDIALLAPYARDTIPAHGLVRGRVRASGSTAAMTVDAEVTWLDEAVPGGAGNSLAAEGRVALGGEPELVFRDLVVRRADFDMHTIRRFAPSVLLDGRLRAWGMLAGPWRNAQFHGSIDQYAEGLVSTVNGDVKLGLTTDTVTIDAELRVDSLNFQLLRRSYPQIPITDVMRGYAGVHGPVTGLTVNTALYGAVGTLTGSGVVGSHDNFVSVDAEGIFDSLDVSRLVAGAPPTALWGHWKAVLQVPTTDSTAVTTGTVRGDITRGRIAGSTLASGEASLRLDTGRMEVEYARLAFIGGLARMRGAVGRGQGASSAIDFDIRSDTLGYLEPVLRWVRGRAGDSSAVKLDGSARVTGRLTGTTENWVLEGDATLGSVDLGGDLGRNLRAHAQLTHGPGGYGFTVSGSADSLAVAGLLYAPVGATVTGRPDSMTVRANAGFLSQSAARMLFTVWTDSASHIRADSLEIDLPVHHWKLMRPAGVLIDSGVVRLDTVELRATEGAGFLRASGALPRRGVANFELVADSVSIADVYSVAQRDTTGISGALNGELHILGAAGSPTIELRLAATDGHFGEYTLPLFQVLAKYEAQRLTIKGGLWRDSVRLVTISGSLPVDLSLRSVPRRKLPGPITVVAQADSLDMTVLDPLIGVVNGLSGRMQIDVRAAGTWEAPEYTGFVDVREGAMTIPALGARYSNMDARVTLQNNVMHIARMQLHGGAGVLDVSGSVVFDSLFTMRPTLNDTLRFSRFAAFNMPDFGSFTGTGQLYLSGPLLGATLTGHAVVDEGSLQFADLVEKRIVSLDDPEFKALVDSSLKNAADLAPSPHTIFFDSLRIADLSISMGNDVWLRSNEASIQLTGDFVINRAIEDQLPRYRMDGTLRAVRGTYKLVLGFENSLVNISRDFRVTRGTVRFFGTPDFNPEMDIAAEHVARTVQGDPLTVRAIIGGTLLYPTLRLESDHRPPLSQTEIVSYLMFGVPPSGTVGNERELGLSVIGGNIIGGLGQALASELGLPLSYLSIQTGTGTHTAGSQHMSTARVEAGVQVSDRTFLTLNAGLCEVLTSQMVGASLEYRFSGRWSTSASFEPVIQACGTAQSLAGLNSRYQLGADLFWQQGIR